MLGLIDCTIMGSCKNGLAITNQGLIWKNDWTTESSQTSLTWHELCSKKEEMRVDQYNLVFSSTIQLNMAGCSMSRVEAFNLFQAIIKLLEEFRDEMYQEDSEVVLIDSSKAETPKLPSDSYKEDNISSEEQLLYEESLISALALMTVADGEIASEEIEIVVEFINEEESIKDKQKAISDYENSIEKLTKAQSKSKAIFKLQSEKLIAGIKKLTNRELIDRLEIMLEGMIDVAGGVENLETVEMMKKIMSGFSK